MMPHPKTMSIPLGLEDVDMWRRTDTGLIQRARDAEKTKLLYLYFNEATNKDLRSDAMRSLQRNGFSKQRRESWSSYIEELSKYKFCASPEGNGIDTHRMWECLYLGVTPIVVRTPALEHWYSDLPILWINTFDQVTKELLHRVRFEIQRGKTLHKHSLYSMRSISASLQREFED